MCITSTLKKPKYYLHIGSNQCKTTTSSVMYELLRFIEKETDKCADPNVYNI